MNQYNFIAPWYDLLKRMVFGKQLDRATSSFLAETSQYKHILIVGGGSGALLSHFNKDQQVWYVEASDKMISLAQKRQAQCQVEFIHQAVQTFKSNQQFDIIILPFFLDQFKDDQIKAILKQCNDWLCPTGELHIVDFNPANQLTKWYQKLLLRTVIVFFSVTTNHRLSKIFNIIAITKESNFQLVEQKLYFGGMVFASKWKKAGH